MGGNIMNKNNYTRLKQEANIGIVVNYLGMQVTRCGSAFFVLCPLPQHTDHHATNCYFKSGWNNLYCNTCGAAINAIDLIMYVKNVSYGEAADTLWELEGKPDWYYATRKKGIKTKPSFQLSRENAAFLGIHFPGYILTPYEFSDRKLSYSSHDIALQYDRDGYLACKMNHLCWQDFMNESQYKEMIKNKARELGLTAQDAMLRCQDSNLQLAFYDVAVNCKTICDQV